MATVAIVGRPNTGKSTLFNRLVGGRIAITLAEPGITRDRLARTAEWLGREFDVIDTGGLVPDSADEMAKQVERQVKVALAEADVVVLVVDGFAGLMPLDEEIASRLRREGRSFLVAVNKRDIKRGYDTSEFEKLNGAKLFSIAAEHGTGVDDLLDEILTRLPSETETPAAATVSLALLGRPNVGKSSLLNRLLGSDRSIVMSTPGTTRDVVEDRFSLDGRSYRLLDTAGIRKHARVAAPVEYYSVSRALDVIERCDVALLVIDATEGPTNQDKKIANLIDSRSKGMVVVANKMDLVPAKLVSEVQKWVADQLKFVGYAPAEFTSALKNRGVLEACRRAGRVYDAGGHRIGKVLLREAVVEKLLRRPPKYNCRVLGLTQANARPPVFKLRVSEPKSVTDSYRRFVVSAIRDCFGFEGYPIILRLTT